MGFGTVCYFCKSTCKYRFCLDCLAELSPEYRYLPVFPNISLGGYLFDYTATFKYVISEIKFSGNYRLGEWFRLLNYEAKIPEIYLDVDYIISVPSFWFKQIIRGRQHIPYLFENWLTCGVQGAGMIRRRQWNRSSYKLNRKEREKNAKQQRFCWKGPTSVQRITLLDDICTTGATIIEISRLLKSFGVKDIYVLCLSYRSM
ncbi:MAG: hypothetical protein VW397_02885 [Candidatus Margulisiibacteriota bacterium]